MARKKKKSAARKPAARRGKKKTARGKKPTGDLIISKARTKAAAHLNVSGDFYGALDAAVREMLTHAQTRAESNNRKTLRPHDL